MTTIKVLKRKEDTATHYHVEVLSRDRTIVNCLFPKNLTLMAGFELTAPAGVIGEMERQHKTKFPRV